MQTLVDLANHGILPFVGRRVECDHLIRFWRDTVDAQGLRALVVLGEAGVGKSRLAARVSEIVRQEKGAVIHARLYAESSTSLGPILAESVSSADVELQLVRVDPSGTINDVASALRRLCRLRPTLVIIEDVHLLDGEALRDASRLLAMLTDETLSLVCFARPVEMPARSVLQPYLIHTMTLEGLVSDDLEVLWSELFAQSVSQSELARLRDATRGNPLALRTVLRSLVPTTIDGAVVNVSVGDAALVSALNRNVDLLAEGMVSHLDESERIWGEQLASLGEVFARSAALQLIEGADAALERLVFRGVIAESTAPPEALQGSAVENDLLFAFTHSLLYDYLVSRRCVDVTRLIRIINAGVPMYSFVPLSIIEARASETDLTDEEREHFVRRMREMVTRTISTPDWRIAERACRTAASLVEIPGSGADEDLRATLRMEVQTMMVSSFLRHAFSRPDEFAALLQPLLSDTAEPRDARRGELRIFALHHALYLTVLRSWDSSFDVEREEYWDEIHAIVARWPELIASRTYALALVGTAQAAGVRNLKQLSELVERKLTEIRDSESIDGDLKRRLLERALVFFVNDFSTEEEYQERLRQLEELEESPYVDRPVLMVRRISFFTQSGWIQKAREVIATALPYFNLREQHRNAFTARVSLLTCRALSGEPMEQMEREAERMLSEYDQPSSSGAREVVALELIVAAQLRLDADAVDRIADRYEDTHYGKQFRVRQSVIRLLGSDAAEALSIHSGDQAELAVLSKSLISGEVEMDLVERLSIELDRPVVRLTDAADRLVLLLLLSEVSLQYRHVDGTTQIDPVVRRSVVRLLDWLAIRGLGESVLAVVRRFGRLLTKKETTEWRRRAGHKESRDGEELPAEGGGDSRIRIQMFGSIQGITASDEVIPIRGSRLSAMLALMTVDRMMAEPFGVREFRHLAAGGEDDPEHARKTMNAAVFRLRDLLGTESVVTHNETPQLNLDVVDVDVLLADRLLRQAARGIRENSLLRARSALLRALEIAKGEILFPSLYEEIFEAAREDFEFRLREMILKVSKRLIREEDVVSAEDILRRSFAFMPEDEEIVETLCELLDSTGRQAEARRIRLTVEMTEFES